MRMLGGAQTVAAPAPTFPELLQQLYAEQHTGPVVIHFAQGHPNVVELPAKPTVVKLGK